jgi:hypothetical protein
MFQATLTTVRNERFAYNLEIVDEMINDDIEIANDIAQDDAYVLFRFLTYVRKSVRIMASGQIADSRDIERRTDANGRWHTHLPYCPCGEA